MDKKQLIEELKKHGIKVVGNYVRKEDLQKLVASGSRIDNYKRSNKVTARDVSLTDAQILELIGEAIDLSSIDASHKELLAEVADSRKHGLTIDEMVEAFRDLREGAQDMEDQYAWGSKVVALAMSRFGSK